MLGDGVSVTEAVEEAGEVFLLDRFPDLGAPDPADSV